MSESTNENVSNGEEEQQAIGNEEKSVENESSSEEQQIEGVSSTEESEQEESSDQSEQVNYQETIDKLKNENRKHSSWIAANKNKVKEYDKMSFQSNPQIKETINNYAQAIKDSDPADTSKLFEESLQEIQQTQQQSQLMAGIEAVQETVTAKYSDWMKVLNEAVFGMDEDKKYETVLALSQLDNVDDIYTVGQRMAEDRNPIRKYLKKGDTVNTQKRPITLKNPTPPQEIQSSTATKDTDVDNMSFEELQALYKKNHNR